jgi:large subunit ribosomal protein L21
MFAIIELGGQQFKVEKGTILKVGRLQEKEGSTIEINKVLLLNDNGKITIGTPFINGAFTSAKVLNHEKEAKIRIFKMKAKKRYRRTKGHRQQVTKLVITDVKATGGKAPEQKAAKVAVATKTAPKKQAATKKSPTKKTAAKVTKKTTKKSE